MPKAPRRGRVGKQRHVPHHPVARLGLDEPRAVGGLDQEVETLPPYPHLPPPSAHTPQGPEPTLREGCLEEAVRQVGVHPHPASPVEDQHEGPDSGAPRVLTQVHARPVARHQQFGETAGVWQMHRNRAPVGQPHADREPVEPPLESRLDLRRGQRPAGRRPAGAPPGALAGRVPWFGAGSRDLLSHSDLGHARRGVYGLLRDATRGARWPRTVAAARAVQERLRKRLVLRGGPRRVRLVAGADLAYRTDGRRAWAAVVVMRWPELSVVETTTAAGRPRFPYVPGYLTFREGPLLLAAFAGLRRRPDLCLLDGHGYAHPRGFGLACHVGVLLDLPTIGCAKSLLVGTVRDPGPARGDWSPIRFGGRVVGAALRTRAGVKPLFVSAGHRIGLRTAIRWVLACSRFRVPEPVRVAEQMVNRLRQASGARS